jgi:hypothetical protein
MGDILETLEMLAEYYRETGERMTDKRLEVYARTLADVPPEVLERAAMDWIRGDGKWFPKVSELLQLAKLQTGLANADFRAYTEPADFDTLAAEEIRLKDQYAAGVFERRDWEALAERYRRAGRIARFETLQARLAHYTGANHVPDRQPIAAGVVCDQPAA